MLSQSISGVGNWYNVVPQVAAPIAKASSNFNWGSFFVNIGKPVLQAGLGLGTTLVANKLLAPKTPKQTVIQQQPQQQADQWIMTDEGIMKAGEARAKYTESSNSGMLMVVAAGILALVVLTKT